MHEAAVAAFEEALTRGAGRVSTADTLVLLKALKAERDLQLTAYRTALMEAKAALELAPCFCSGAFVCSRHKAERCIATALSKAEGREPRS